LLRSSERGMKRFALSILLVGILVALGFGGWKYWQNRDAKQTKTALNNTQKNNDPSEGGKYLVIKEWGVRFSLTKDIKDASYIYVNDYGIRLISEKLKQLPGCEDDQRMTLERAKNPDDSLGPNTTLADLLKHNPTILTKVDNYHYLLYFPSYACTTDQSQKTVDLLSEVSEAFKDSIKKLESTGGNN